MSHTQEAPAGLASTWCSKKEVELHVKPNDIANVLITGIGGSRINAVIDNSLRDLVKRESYSTWTPMDPDVPANDHGNRTTMKRQLDATSRNLKALVQKDNILPSILPPVARNVIVSKTLPLILKMGLVLKNIQEGHVLKEGS